MVNLALVIVYGGGPSDEAIGIKYRENPGPFVQYKYVDVSLGTFLGFWATITNAMYAYQGIENVSLVPSEARKARQTIHQAAKRVVWRVLIFCVITLFLVGLVVPSNNGHLPGEQGTAASPFVIASKKTRAAGRAMGKT